MKIHLMAQVTIFRIDTATNWNINFNPDNGNLSRKIYLTGEFHGVSSNPMTEYYSLKYFVQYKGVTNILLEAGYTDSYLINNYLNTGDTLYLDLYTSDYPLKYQEIKTSLRTTKKLFDSLSNEKKFSFISIDIIENESPTYGYKLMDLLVKNKIFNDSLKSAIIKLNIDSFPNKIDKYESQFLAFKPDQDFDSSILEIIRSYKYWIQNNHLLFKNRQTYLYKRIIEKTKNINTGNFYGQFGYGHIDLKQKCMAYFLDHDPIYQNKVFSIYPYYYNCNSSFFKQKKRTGYNTLKMTRLIKKNKLTSGIYLINRKNTYYNVHIDQKEMTELVDNPQ